MTGCRRSYYTPFCAVPAYAAEESSFGADDGVEFVIEQVYSVVGTCQGAVGKCAWKGEGERERWVFGAFVLSFILGFSMLM